MIFDNKSPWNIIAPYFKQFILTYWYIWTHINRHKMIYIHLIICNIYIWSYTNIYEYTCINVTSTTKVLGHCFQMYTTWLQAARDFPSGFPWGLERSQRAPRFLESQQPWQPCYGHVRKHWQKTLRLLLCGRVELKWLKCHVATGGKWGFETGENAEGADFFEIF